MTSYLWRSTSGEENVSKQGTRTSAADVITFSINNVSDGKYLHQTQFDFIVGIGENEKPKGNINEIQDTFLDSITLTLTGSVNTATGGSSIFDLIKKWMIEAKTDTVFTKGRFGLELDDVDSYNLIPTGTGSSTEQPRGYVLSNWRWVRTGEIKSKTEFIATLRFNGDLNVDASSNGNSSRDYDWTVNR